MPRLILSMKPFYPLFLPPPLSLSLLFLREGSVDFFFSIGWCKKRRGPIIFERVDLKDFKVIIPSEISLEISLFLKVEEGRKKKNSKRRRIPNKLGKED